MKNKYKYPVNKIRIISSSYSELLIEIRRLFQGSVFGNHTFLSWLLGSVWNTIFLKQKNPPFQQRMKMTEVSIFTEGRILRFLYFHCAFVCGPLLRGASSLSQLVSEDENAHCAPGLFFK